MTHKEEILKLANENHGVLFSEEVSKLKLSKSALHQLVKEEALFPVQRGIYVTEDGYVDDYVLVQHRFKGGVFSHETALYLLGYSDRIPQEMTMSFKHGRSTRGIREEMVVPVMVSHHWDLGIKEVVKNGLPIRVYNIERTLVDLLKPRYHGDLEQVVPALKQYAQSQGKDVNRLLSYAKVFGVERTIQHYIGVLL